MSLYPELTWRVLYDLVIIVDLPEREIDPVLGHAPGWQPSKELVEPVLDLGVKLLHFCVVQENRVLCLPDIDLTSVNNIQIYYMFCHGLSPESPGPVLGDQSRLTRDAAPGWALLPRHQPPPEAGLEDEHRPQPPPSLQLLVTDQSRMMSPPPDLDPLGGSFPLTFYI